MAIAHAAAAAQGLRLWRWLDAGREEFFLPLPEVQIYGGGAAAQGACNAALIKPDPAGTLSETRAAFDAAAAAGWGSIVSPRSGESEDVTIAHLAAGWGARQLKVGSFSRSERLAKWNERLRLAEAQGQGGGRVAPRAGFPWGRT